MKKSLDQDRCILDDVAVLEVSTNTRNYHWYEIGCAMRVSASNTNGEDLMYTRLRYLGSLRDLKIKRETPDEI